MAQSKIDLPEDLLSLNATDDQKLYAKDKKKSELIEKEENVTEKITVNNSSNVEPNAKEHVQQLQRLQEKDPEFYEFLKEHGQDLLEFEDDEDDEENEIDDDGTEMQEGSDADMDDEKPAKEKKTSRYAEGYYNVNG
ncbi:hypothetical protein ACHQM5_016367 [Ranunculus cassubicifolius]